MTATVPRQRIRKVLIANRGEIAVRILRGLREMGIRGAVIYSEPDRLGLPVLLADEAYPIGPAPSRESYLRAEAIVELAKEIGADAIHPGYGFLSERAGFARLCRDAGITFIGPSPEAIDAMGSKVESRRLMIAAGVPVVPGGKDPLPDLEAAAAAAETIGYPVMLKAAAGGGGKGMRMIPSAAELPSAYRAARSEAGASFGDDSVYLEKFIVDPRHVEIQVMGDLHGKVVSLGERECSLQRRHQKVVEEAPSPVVDPELRRRMGEAAVKAASAVGYSNAGTCEFLLDQRRQLLLPGDEHPPPGGAPGHRAGHRHRPRAGADPGRRGRAARPRVRRRPAARPRRRGPPLRRGPLPALRPLAGQDRDPPLARRPRRPGGQRRLRGLRGLDPLRPDARQADRLGRGPRARPRPPGARPLRAARRGHPHHRCRSSAPSSPTRTSAPATWTSACSTASSPRASCIRSPETDALDDLPLIAAALAHHEQAHRQTRRRARPRPAASRRSRWGAAGRRGAHAGEVDHGPDRPPRRARGEGPGAPRRRRLRGRPRRPHLPRGRRCRPAPASTACASTAPSTRSPSAGRARAPTG